MEHVYTREANSEVLVCSDIHYSTRLALLEEAVKILQREVIREKGTPQRGQW